MSEVSAPGPANLGFLTVFQEGAGYLGGYLITNSWGRPLEFRLSTAVQPNRVQQILYGPTLQEYLCADLIGKTLIDKSSTPVQFLFTDSLNVLPIRTRLEIPVFAVVPPDDNAAAFIPAERVVRFTDERSAASFYYEARHPGDADRLRGLLEQVDRAFDPAEPFGRIREAMHEARKLGVTSRAA